MPTVTVAIPTLNRADYIFQTIESVLAQTFSDFKIIIIDNASTDNTHSIIQSFSNDRLEYNCNNYQLSMIDNWNHALKLCNSDFICILGDDDQWLPEFLERSISVLRNHSSVGFTFSHCNKVDLNGRFIQRWGYNFPPPGLIKGYDYLEYTLKYGCCLTNSSTVMIRKKALETVGLFQSIFACNTFDFNLWIRLASQFNVYFIDEVLANYRIHNQQASERHWRTSNSPTGELGTTLESLYVVALLMQNRSYKNPDLLADQLVRLASRQARLMKLFVSDF